MHAPENTLGWSPTSEGLEYLITLLSGTRTKDNEAHRRIYEELQKLARHEEYPLYLASVFSSHEDNEIRSIAGLGGFDDFSPEIQIILKSFILPLLADRELEIRKITSNLLATVVKKASNIANSIPEIFADIVENLKCDDLNLVDGLLRLLTLICEDTPHKLDNNSLGRPYNRIIPALLDILSGSNIYEWKLLVIKALNSVMDVMPRGLLINLDSYLEALFSNGSDERWEMRKLICEGFTQVLSNKATYIYNHMEPITEYIFYNLQDTVNDSDEVTKECFEFFATLFIQEERGDENSTTYIREIMPRLVPFIIDKLVYSHIELIDMDGPERDITEYDRVEDIKPYIHSSRGEGRDSEDVENEWTVRKSAGACLELLALSVKGDVLGHIFPTIVESVSSDDWLIKESALLALGCISEGCMHEMGEILPDAFQFLLQAAMNISGSKYLLRCIAHWVIGRYAIWMVLPNTDKEVLRTTIGVLLDCIRKEVNKKAQSAALSAIAVIEDAVGGGMKPFIQNVLDVLVPMLEKVPRKNFFILCDAINSLAIAVGESICKNEFLEYMLPNIVEKWNRLSDEDILLVPLLDLISSLSSLIRTPILPYARPIWRRSLSILRSQFETGRWESNLVCALLELFSGMIDGLGILLGELIEDPLLMDVVLYAIEIEDISVKQSAFSVVGDVARTSEGVIVPHILQDRLSPALISSIDPEILGSTNNAIWALGEMFIKLPEQMNSYSEAFIVKIIPILAAIETMNVDLAETAAIAIGRISLFEPEIVFNEISCVFPSWCYIIGDIKSDLEREAAYRGFCNVLRVNPSSLQVHISEIAVALYLCTGVSEELFRTIVGVLTIYKDLAGENSFLEDDVTMRVKIQKKYGV